MKAFYFSKEDRKLCYGDNRQIRVGRTHKVKGEIELCKNGLHASKRLIDTLGHAPGPILYEVELSGTIVKGSDKAAASKRTYLRSFNAEKVLREFARKQALIYIEKIKPHCSEEDYDLIVRFLESGDESIREEAYRAAWAAHRATEAARTAWTAYRAAWAAWAAYWAADWAAAESAAESADAARAAARASANASGNYEKHMEEANEMLTDMIRKETGWEI